MEAGQAERPVRRRGPELGAHELVPPVLDVEPGEPALPRPQGPAQGIETKRGLENVPSQQIIDRGGHLNYIFYIETPLQTAGVVNYLEHLLPIY